MNALSTALVELATSQNLKFLAIQEAARTDAKIAALYQIWLVATDCSEDEPPYVLNEVISKIDRLAKVALGIV